eukprot:CAMPEP_0202443438 /NCGR_PEP_ID=MMETSP1360-20130828/2699_1 /ASSEMBLY_ACC=CAM_ASM_000848 /TAXON_ID=515479 /ORGANISM="Licmophora paradoxa, Strain CCMP2313" /LENGTH=428 /DNA_ID=CAMNT_0049059123 /DNA_START=344 /DNA_END=1630 /DNA_ORIENTATION=-
MSSKLREWASAGKLRDAKLSEDGGRLSLGGESIDSGSEIAIEFNGKSCSYTLASIFLQILDPSQSLLTYRNACKKYGVKDHVKPLDKPSVIGFFVGPVALPPPPPPPKERRSDDDHRSKDRDRKRKHEKSRKHDKDRKRPEPPPKKEKKSKEFKPEQVIAGLNVVVDKRQMSGESSELTKSLSASGFELTPEMIKSTFIAAIVANEIPVGNSASILCPEPNRDFQRVLDLFLETEKKKVPTTPAALARPYLVGKKPIIILPKGMTSPITMLNAHEFFNNRIFVPRDVMRKKGASKQNIKSTLVHKIDVRRGGAEVEFELMDNPRAKLGSDPHEWERIVAVISLGAAWQFKDWPRGYSNPVDLFGRVFGFYIGMEGDKLPEEIFKWAVKRGKLHRDKRGLDSVCFATFWEGLENRMVTKKPELVPRQDR